MNYNKKLIIFSHHFVNNKIKNRFDNLKKLNLDWDIVSVGFEGYSLLENSVHINKKKYPTNKNIHYHVSRNHVDWFDGDLCLYEIYQQFPFYEEYFLYEYDTICNVSIEKFFNTNVDFFGSTVCNPADENWEWVKLYRLHNDNNHVFKTLYSCGQTTVIYFKNNILKKCTEEILKNKCLYNSMFSEVRCGTIVSQFATLKPAREDIKNFISWFREDITVNENIPHFYHPVK